MILCAEVPSDFRTWPLAVQVNVLSCLSVEDRARLQWCSLVQHDPTLTRPWQCVLRMCQLATVSRLRPQSLEYCL